MTAKSPEVALRRGGRMETVEQARAAGLPARLQVFRTQPARALYARLGFETLLVAVDHETMEWTSA